MVRPHSGARGKKEMNLLNLLECQVEYSDWAVEICRDWGLHGDLAPGSGQDPYGVSGEGGKRIVLIPDHWNTNANLACIRLD